MKIYDYVKNLSNTNKKMLLAFILGLVFLSWCAGLALTTKEYNLVGSTLCASNETIAQPGPNQPECIYKLAFRSHNNAAKGEKPRVVTVLLHDSMVAATFAIIGFVLVSFLSLFWFITFGLK